MPPEGPLPTLPSFLATKYKTTSHPYHHTVHQTAPTSPTYPSPQREARTLSEAEALDVHLQGFAHGAGAKAKADAKSGPSGRTAEQHGGAGSTARYHAGIGRLQLEAALGAAQARNAELEWRLAAAEQQLARQHPAQHETERRYVQQAHCRNLDDIIANACRRKEYRPSTVTPTLASASIAGATTTRPPLHVRHIAGEENAAAYANRQIPARPPPAQTSRGETKGLVDRILGAPPTPAPNRFLYSPPPAVAATPLRESWGARRGGVGVLRAASDEELQRFLEAFQSETDRLQRRAVRGAPSPRHPPR
jgi:hypothetical protein